MMIGSDHILGIFKYCIVIVFNITTNYVIITNTFLDTAIFKKHIFIYATRNYITYYHSYVHQSAIVWLIKSFVFWILPNPNMLRIQAGEHEKSENCFCSFRVQYV